MLDALLLADLRNVNQSFLHAQILYDRGLRVSGEQGYRQSVFAMNRSMRLMLAMLAARRPIGFDAVPDDDPLGRLQLESDAAAIFAADLALLDRLLAHLRRTRAALPASDGALQTLLDGFETEHVTRRAWQVARIDALVAATDDRNLGEPAPDGKPSRLDGLRELSRSYHPAWAAALAAGKRDGAGAAVTGREIGRLIGTLLVLNEQSFIHAFLLRHWGRGTEANRTFEFSIDAMRYAYVLCELALLRGAPAAVVMPRAPDACAALGADPASALANERRGSQSFAAQIGNALEHVDGDATLASLLAHMQAAHRSRALELAPPDAGDADRADAAAPSDDLIAAMLVRWRIEDPTAAGAISA